MLRSALDAALADGVEQEKCVLSSLKTAPHQKQALLQLVADNGRAELPLEWVIDIADEKNGWFIGTAYSWRDATGELYIMVPDRFSPTFEGWVRLDYRTVRLVECVDTSSRALFNKLLRDSIVKVRWEVEWCEETDDSVGGGGGGGGTQIRQWIPSIAKYYIRLSNQVLLEDHLAQEKAFVLAPADQNLRLIRCVWEKGLEDFRRLLDEGVVLRGEQVQQNGDYHANGNAAEPDPSLQEISAIADNCRKMSALIEECEAERIAFSRLFIKYIMEGSLEDGAKLLEQAEAVVTRSSSSTTSSLSTTASSDGPCSELAKLVRSTEELAQSVVASFKSLSSAPGVKLG